MLALGVVFLSILILLEWRFDFDFSLGILYVFPVMIAGTVLKRWQIVISSIFCAYTRGLFTADETHLEHILRFCMATIAYTGCGLLIYQITESRRVVMMHYARIRFEQKLRRRAEEQLRLMAESSPAAILTIGANGEILAANSAAEEVFLVDQGSLLSREIRPLVPLFYDALRLADEISGIRTQASTWAHRSDGSHFPATTWFSVYGKEDRKRLAAILVDTSTEVREREQAHFNDLLHLNRVLAGAVSHEIRNLCAAIAVVQRNLASRAKKLVGDEDFEALTRLIDALSHISTFDLRNQSHAPVAPMSLSAIADSIHIIIGQDWADAGGEIIWHIDPSFPSVHADRQGLLQILLNLSQNALRAVEHSQVKRLTITATATDKNAILRVSDTGPGILDGSSLFQPFRPGQQSSGAGLGLYVSRAIAKSFGGDLRHIPTPTGCTFEIQLRLVAATQEAALTA